MAAIKDLKERIKARLAALKKLKIIKARLQREFFGIENRTDLTDDEKVKKIIHITSAGCAGVAVQPIPFADILILTPIQAYMGTRIAAVRGIPFSIYKVRKALKAIQEILGIVGLGLAAQQCAIGAYKMGVPALGGFTTLPLVYGLTYGIGRVMDAYLVQKARGQLVDERILKEIWEKAKQEGESSADEEAARRFGDEINKKDKDND